MAPSSPPTSENSSTEASAVDSAYVRQAAISGAKALGLRTVLSIALSIISKFAVGRLMAPAETSIFNTGTQITGPVQFLGEGFLGSGLVRQETAPTDDEYFSVFVLQLGITITSVTVLLLSLPWILSVYHLSPSAAPVLVVLAICLLLSSQRVLPLLYFERALRFDIIARVEMIENVTQVFSLVALALAHLGTWALTISFAIRMLVGAGTYWFHMPWRPRGRFDWKIVRRLATFGVPQQLCAMVPTWGGLWLAIAVNRFTGAEGMGFVGMAASLASIPMMLSNILNRVAFSAYSRLSGDRSEQGRSLVTSLKLFGIALGVLVPLFVAISPIFVPLFLGAKWKPCIELLQWNSLTVVISTLTGLIAQNQSAAGRPIERLAIASFTAVLSWTIGYNAVHFFKLDGIGPSVFSVAFIELALSFILVQKNSVGCGQIIKEVAQPVFSLLLAAVAGLVLSRILFPGNVLLKCLSSFGLFAVFVLLYDAFSKGMIIRREIFRLLTRFSPKIATRLGIS